MRATLAAYLCCCSALHASPPRLHLQSATTLLRSKHVVLLAGSKRAPKRKAAAAGGFGKATVKTTGKVAGKSKASAPSIGSSRPEWRGFERWLAKSGATVDAVTLADCGGGLRGVKATRAIAAGEEVMRIPRSVILDVPRAEASAVSGLWRGEPAAELPGYAKLALAVCLERRLGAASPLAPYIDLLPTREEFEAEGGPAAAWSDEELAHLECGKLISDARSMRERRDGGGHPALQPAVLAERWERLGLAGPPPEAEEIAWAVTAVTSRAYTLQAPGAEPPDDAPPVSGLIPMVDMANHNGELQPHTAKGLDDATGASFVVIATRRIAKGEQVYLTYGPLPNHRLLTQWGFVLPAMGAPPDVGLVDISHLLEAEGGRAWLQRAAEEGKLMRESSGAPSAWQPVGPALQAAMVDCAAEGDGGGGERGAGSSAGGGDDGALAPLEAGARAYRQLLQRQLERFSTSAADDLAEMEAAGVAPRKRLALQFRRAQRGLLNRAIADSMGGTKRARAPAGEV